MEIMESDRGGCGRHLMLHGTMLTSSLAVAGTVRQFRVVEKATRWELVSGAFSMPPPGRVETPVRRDVVVYWYDSNTNTVFKRRPG